MLDENQVIDLLTKYLVSNGHEIKQKLSTKEKGIDLIAKKKNKTLLVEAKGETSSREGSERYGKVYTSSQIFDRVAKGMYTAVKTAESCKEDEVSCLAFPDSALFKEYLSHVKHSLGSLGIVVYIVSQNGVVIYD